MRRVECRNCGDVVIEEIPWSDGKRQLTRAYMLFLARWARKLSWKESAEVFHISCDQVCDAVEYVVGWGLEHRTLESIRAIGVDEIQYAKGTARAIAEDDGAPRPRAPLSSSSSPRAARGLAQIQHLSARLHGGRRADGEGGRPRAQSRQGGRMRELEEAWIIRALGNSPRASAVCQGPKERLLGSACPKIPRKPEAPAVPGRSASRGRGPATTRDHRGSPGTEAHGTRKAAPCRRAGTP